MNKMRTSTNPNDFGYSVFILSFALLHFNIIEAQNIVPFPAAKSPPISPESANIVDEQVFELIMSGATTTKDDQLVCTGYTLPDELFSTPIWIIQFEGIASASVVHHMALYGCDTVPTKACGCEMNSRSPLYSWVRSTPKVRYTGTGSSFAGGFRIGGTSDNQYLFLEIHYQGGTTNDQSGITIHTTSTSPTLDLAIFPIMGKGTIPANTASYNMDTCTSPFPLAGSSGIIFYIGFQVHSHNLGRLISGYVVNNNQVTLKIGRGNPLWPEAYVEITPPDTQTPQIKAGDLFITRCVYSSSGVSSATNTNGLPKTNYQEMCIFNLLIGATFQLSTKNAFLKGTCSSSALLDGQSDSTTLITENYPNLDIAAAYGNITSGNYPYDSSRYTIRMEKETFSYTFL